MNGCSEEGEEEKTCSGEDEEMSAFFPFCYRRLTFLFSSSSFSPVTRFTRRTLPDRCCRHGMSNPQELHLLNIMLLMV